MLKCPFIFVRFQKRLLQITVVVYAFRMPELPKDWKSYKEQIAILQSRGMVIDDMAEAEHCLSRIGYYRLSGYSYPFRQYDKTNKKALDNFKGGTNFSDVVNLYNFDRKLRLLALDAIERIELAVQVEVAYLLGERDPLAHLNPAQLHTKFSTRKHKDVPSPYEKWLSDYAHLVDRAKRKTFVEHNLEKYGELPIWVAIEIFDFGTLSKLYAGMKVQDKIKIESPFGLVKGNEFQTWLRGFNFIRNLAAHHGRLWNCNILEIASVPATKIKLHQLDNTRPFFYFCLMQSILKVICPASKWKDEFIALIDSFPVPQNKVVSIQNMGVVDGWKNWEIWR